MARRDRRVGSKRGRRRQAVSTAQTVAAEVIGRGATAAAVAPKLGLSVESVERIAGALRRRRNDADLGGGCVVDGSMPRN